MTTTNAPTTTKDSDDDDDDDDDDNETYDVDQKSNFLSGLKSPEIRHSGCSVLSAAAAGLCSNLCSCYSNVELEREKQSERYSIRNSDREKKYEHIKLVKSGLERRGEKT